MDSKDTELAIWQLSDADDEITSGNCCGAKCCAGGS
jgi:hypothetical protein